MIINLDEHNITADYYAFVKDGTVRKRTLKRACGELPFVVVSFEYHLRKPFYDTAVRQIVKKSLAVFTLYGQGDVRMTELLEACKKYDIHLEDLLCPDRRLKLDEVSKAVDLLVLDYLENKVLSELVDQLREGDDLPVSRDVTSAAMEAVREFAAQTASLINSVIQDRSELAQPIKDVQRGFREDRLRAAAAQLNSYSAAAKELTS